jgi:chemotaxis protein methyltransferase CheR
MTRERREPLPPELRPDLRLGFARLIEARLGLVFAASREPFLDQALHDALEHLGEISARVLLERLQRDDATAWSALTATVTVGETYFFREPAHYEFLRALLGRARASSARPVRLWSAACASGAEPYSMAAIACEVFGPEAPRRVEILATDVNAQALAQARAGLYRAWYLRDMDEATRERWFTHEDGSWRVRPVLADMVRFAPLNLTEPDDAAWPGRMDVIFCRNVLLYFNQTALEQTAQHLTRALEPEGWLIVGPADPMLTGPGLALDTTPGFPAYRSAPDARAVASPAAPAPRAAPAPPLAPVRPPSKRQRRRTSRQPLRDVQSALSAAAPAPEAHAAGPDASEALERARALGDAGHIQAALATLDRALDGEPLAEAYLLRAALRQAQGDHRGAIAEARRALLLDRTLAYAHFLAAGSHTALGERDHARRALRNARAILAMLTDDTRIAGIPATAAELRAACRQLQHACERSQSPEEP